MAKWKNAAAKMKISQLKDGNLASRSAQLLPGPRGAYICMEPGI